MLLSSHPKSNGRMMWSGMLSVVSLKLTFLRLNIYFVITVYCTASLKHSIHRRKEGRLIKRMEATEACRIICRHTVITWHDRMMTWRTDWVIHQRETEPGRIWRICCPICTGVYLGGCMRSWTEVHQMLSGLKPHWAVSPSGGQRHGSPACL